MDLGSLIAAVLLSIGMIGADAAINAGTIGFKVEVTEDLSKRGYTHQLVDALLNNSLRQLVDYRSVVHPATIRSAEDKSIVGAIAESLNLKDVTASFQAELGLNPIRITGTLMTASANGEECGRSASSMAIGAAMSDGKPTSDAAAPDGKQPSRAAEAAAGIVSATAAPAPTTTDARDDRLRFILSGLSRHTGNFIIDCTSPKDQPLPVFINVVATEIIKRVEPYAAAIALFNEMHGKHAFMQQGTQYAALKSFVEERLKSEAGGEDSTYDYAAFHNLVGMAAMMAGKNDDAAIEFSKAIVADPELGYALINQGILNIAQQRFDDALGAIEKAQMTKSVSKAPFLLANALTVKALALWAKKDLQGASDSFMAAARVYPGTFFVYYYWAQLMASAGNADVAALLTQRANTNISNFDTYPESALLYFSVRPEDKFSLTHLNMKLVKSVSDVGLGK